LSSEILISFISNNYASKTKIPNYDALNKNINKFMQLLNNLYSTFQSSTSEDFKSEQNLSEV